MRTEQDAVGAMQGEERADRKFFGTERAIESGSAIQLALRRQLRDLPADAAFRTHLAAVERVDRARIALQRAIAATETTETLPPLRTRATQAKADPSQLQGREPITGITLQARDGTLGRRTEPQKITALRRRRFQQIAQCLPPLRLAPCGRQRHLQIAMRLCLGERSALTRHAGRKLWLCGNGTGDAPAELIEYADQTRGTGAVRRIGHRR